MSNISYHLRQNNRRILRGSSYDDRRGTWIIQAREGETIKPVFDLTHWLDSETVAALSVTSDGTTITSAESSGVITLTISGVTSCHDATLTITTSGGRVLKEKLRITEPNTTYRDDYHSLVSV